MSDPVVQFMIVHIDHSGDEPMLHYKIRIPREDGASEVRGTARYGEMIEITQKQLDGDE